MALPRSKYVQEGQEGVYHCFSRCVRRAFLCGFDAVTRRDFCHRKTWLVERLRFLATVFAIEVCAYAVMENHYHTILRTRPDIAALWSDREVATRWLTLFPRHRDSSGSALPLTEKEISALADCPERIAQLRERLCSLSWFMGRLNEFIARAANKEDRVKGRFWESRFKCQALLDEAAIAACMVYVDLNPIRAGRAASPEESDFASIQERIRAWQKDHMTTAEPSGRTSANGTESAIASEDRPTEGNDCETADILPDSFSATPNFLLGTAAHALWLCPIQSVSGRRGILNITEAEYFDLVDKSGRMIRSDKPAALDATLAPIFQRISANPRTWPETITHFGSRFRLAAGLLANLRNFAGQIGRRWLMGAAAARAAFASAPSQMA